MEIQHLGKGDGPPIKVLFHIADIHLRPGDKEKSRYEEYIQVLNRFCDELRDHWAIREKCAAIVICGDIFHTYGRMDATTAELFFRWMDRMVHMAPVLLIDGNHELRADDQTYPNVLEVMTAPYRGGVGGTERPVYHLANTGHYAFRNLGIGIVAVKDTVKLSRGRALVETLPTFPHEEAFRKVPAVTHTLALFHGDMAEKVMPGGWETYPIQWIVDAGYSRLLLGDIHTQSVRTATTGDRKMIYGYPGSLIQQNYGETLYGHGYLTWDLEKGSVTRHHIRNDYGMLTIKLRSDAAVVAILEPRKCVSLKDICNEPDFPKMLRVRFLGKLKDADNVKETCKNLGVDISKFMTSLPVNTTTDASGNEVLDFGAMFGDGIGEGGEGGEDGEGARSGAGGETSLVGGEVGLKRDQREMLSDLNSPLRWCEYLVAVEPSLSAESAEGAESVAVFVRTPEKMAISLSPEETAAVSPDMVAKIRERNVSLQKLYEEYRAASSKTQNEVYKITLSHMYWSYAMCYDQKNWLNFSEIEGLITLLNGPNCSGKSSLLDVLCIGFFGEPTRSRTVSGRSMSSKIINDQRSNASNVNAMNVQIMFTMDGFGTYEIYRSFGHQLKKESGNSNVRAIQATVYHINTETNDKVIVCEGSSSVDAWVTKYIGTLDQILMSTIVSQMDIYNYFSMSQENQKALLDKALNLDAITVFSRVLHEGVLAHAAIIGKLTTAIETLKIGPTGAGMGGLSAASVNTDAIATEIAELEGKRVMAMERRDALFGQLATLVGKGTSDGVAEIKNAKKKLEKAQATLATFSDLSNEDREAALMIKGTVRARWEAIQNELATLRGGEGGDGEGGDGDAADGRVQDDPVELKKLMDMHRNVKPTLTWSDADIKVQEKIVAKWKKRGGDQVDPDQVNERLDELREELTEQEDAFQRLMKIIVRMPTVSEPDVDQMRKKVAANAIIHSDDLDVAREKLRVTTDKWSTAVKAAVNPRRPRDGLEEWKARYATWRDDGAEGADGDGEGVSAADLIARIAHYTDFIAAFEKKEAERQAILGELAEIADLEAQMADLPFNPECWACKKQPMRTLLDKKLVQKAERNKVLARIQRYITKCGVDPVAEAAGGPTEYMARMRDEMRDATEALARRQRYENAREWMETEEAAWAAAATEWVTEDAWRAQVAKLESAMDDWKAVVAKMEWMIWRQWSESDAKMRSRLDIIRADITRDEATMVEYDNMSKLLERIGEERAAREALNHWTAEGARLEAAISCAERDTRRRELIAQSDEVTAAMNVNGEAFDRLMEWERCLEDIRLLEAFICREDLAKAQTTLESVENKLEKTREALGRVRQEEAECIWRGERIKILSGILRRLQARKERIALIEERFSGDKSNDGGYREWIYVNRVLPLIEKEINLFLSVTDTMRFKIQYRNKRLYYIVLSEGSEPTLDHCSGYQKYLINLAMRTALTKVSSIGQNISAILIDEGFTACDATNIQNARAILKNIMTYSGHKHLIIMSHLETIREAADKRIDIQRNARTSTIQFGAEYPKILVKKPDAALTAPTVAPGAPAVTVPKARGRPKKATVA